MQVATLAASLVLLTTLWVTTCDADSVFIRKQHNHMTNVPVEPWDPCIDDCFYGAKCERDINNVPKCVCFEGVTDDSAPVCGSDLKIYKNLSYLRLERCKTQYDLIEKEMEFCTNQGQVEEPED